MKPAPRAFQALEFVVVDDLVQLRAELPVDLADDGLDDAVEDEDYPTIELTVTVPEQLAGAALPPEGVERDTVGGSLRGSPVATA